MVEAWYDTEGDCCFVGHSDAYCFRKWLDNFFRSLPYSNNVEQTFVLKIQSFHHDPGFGFWLAMKPEIPFKPASDFINELVNTMCKHHSTSTTFSKNYHLFKWKSGSCTMFPNFIGKIRNVVHLPPFCEKRAVVLWCLLSI